MASIAEAAEQARAAEQAADEERRQLRAVEERLRGLGEAGF